MIRAGDLRAATNQLREQFALSSFPSRDLLARGSIQQPEIVFDFAEIRQQFAGRCRQLLIAVTYAGGVQHGDVARFNRCDLRIEFSSAPTQFSRPHFGVNFGSVHNLTQ